MELTPPIQKQRRTSVIKSTKVNGNNSKTTNYTANYTTNYTKNRNVEMYRPPTDVSRERMIDDLRSKEENNNNVNNVLPLNSSISFNRGLEPQISTLIPIPKIDAKKYSYTVLAALRRRKILTNEEYLNAKAVKAGFRDQYERVLTRYSENLKLYRENNFRNGKEKSKILKKVKSMEKYLKEAEKLRNSRPRNGYPVVGHHAGCLVEA